MPPFPPNQLAGPPPQTMGGLMNQGIASRARFAPPPPPQAGMLPPPGGGVAPPTPTPEPPSGPNLPGGLPGGPPPGMPSAGPAPPQAGPGGMGGMGGPAMMPGAPASRLAPTAAVREAADDAAIQTALQGTNNDPDTAVETLLRAGHQSAAVKLQESARQHRAREIQRRYDDVAHRVAAMRIGERLLTSATDDPSLDVVRSLTTKIMPQMNRLLQGNFDRVAPNIQQFVRMTAPLAQELEGQKQALDGMRSAIRTGDPQEWTRAAGLVLSSAKDAQQWTQLIDTLRQAGVPSEVLNRFDTVYSDDAVAKAQRIAGHTGPSQEEVQGTPFADMGLLASLRGM